MFTYLLDMLGMVARQVNHVCSTTKVCVLDNITMVARQLKHVSSTTRACLLSNPIILARQVRYTCYTSYIYLLDNLIMAAYNLLLWDGGSTCSCVATIKERVPGKKMIIDDDDYPA